MTETAIVLFVKATNSVLATVTRTGDPAAAPPAAELAGDRFPVRGDDGAVVVEVAAAALESKVVPLVDDLLLNPQQCAVTDDAAALLGSETLTVTVAASGVTVATTNPVTEEAAVWVQLDSGSGDSTEREVLTGKILANEGEVVLPKTLTTGDYGVLALVKGLAPLIDIRSV